MRHPPLASFRHAHRGAALIVSMMMLIAITLVGVAVMGNSRLEWLIASNSNLKDSVLTRAQQGLIAGEVQLRTQLNPTPANAFPWAGNDPFYDGAASLPAGADPRVVADWLDGSFTSGTTDLHTSKTQNRYIVIYQGCTNVPGATGGCGTTSYTETYEVWSLATDAEDTAARIVRSTFVRTRTITPDPDPTKPPIIKTDWRRIAYTEI